MSSDKKKSKRRKDEYTGPGGNEDVEKSPPKDEFKVAKWMKKNIPTKKTKFLNHNVEYFTASKALDALLTTSFALGDNALFGTREEAIQFLDSMLVHKFFHRAKKVPVSEAELRRGKKVKEQPAPQDHQHGTDGCCGGGGNGDEANAELRKRAAKSSAAAGGSNTVDKTATEGSEADVNKSPKTPGGSNSAEAAGGAVEKKKRKIRLDMHPDQQFVDGGEAYIWIYDPIPVHYWLIGTLLVIGAIVVCLFPLWPPTLRLGVYYLSVAAAGFLVFILSLAFVRFVIFCIVWVLTGSKHHFWLFPNLTEDVGFFASFWPLYQHDYVDGGTCKKAAKGGSKVGRKSKKDKLSDAEEESAPLTTTAPTTKNDSATNEKKGATAAADLAEANASGVDTEQDEDELEENRRRSHSDSESECSQKSSTGKDFEMVNPEEVELS